MPCYSVKVSTTNNGSCFSIQSAVNPDGAVLISDINTNGVEYIEVEEGDDINLSAFGVKQIGAIHCRTFAYTNMYCLVDMKLESEDPNDTNVDMDVRLIVMNIIIREDGKIRISKPTHSIPMGQYIPDYYRLKSVVDLQAAMAYNNVDEGKIFINFHHGDEGTLEIDMVNLHVEHICPIVYAVFDDEHNVPFSSEHDQLSGAETSRCRDRSLLDYGENSVAYFKNISNKSDCSCIHSGEISSALVGDTEYTVLKVIREDFSIWQLRNSHNYKIEKTIIVFGDYVEKHLPYNDEKTRVVKEYDGISKVVETSEGNDEISSYMVLNDKIIGGGSVSMTDDREAIIYAYPSIDELTRISRVKDYTIADTTLFTTDLSSKIKQEKLI